MTTLTFSYLDYLTHVELISLLKRIAKQTQKKDETSKPLAWYQDFVAQALGYKNWSQLHKHLDGLTGTDFDLVVRRVLEHKDIGSIIAKLAVRTINVEDAIEEMTRWARKKYTPLVNFAFYDNESETGYSWPDVDMAEELAAEFEGRFPIELIQQVGNDLDVDEGPWGIEDYGDD